MNKLKRLALSLTLIAVLAPAAFAGETDAPPCAPGETHAPPCTAQPLTDDSADPGETETPPALPVVDVTDAVRPCSGRCRCSNPSRPPLAFADATLTFRIFKHSRLPLMLSLATGW